jgi:hypothetical protein
MAAFTSVVQSASAVAIGSHFFLALTFTLAFYVMELITAVISFMLQAPGFELCGPTIRVGS